MSLRQSMLRLYSGLLRLYPGAFRTRFAEEMLATFAEALDEAAACNPAATWGVCLRDLRDAPRAILGEHWRTLEHSISLAAGGACGDTPGILPMPKGRWALLAVVLVAHRGRAQRLFDVAFAALGLAVSAPLLLALAILVRLDSPGPAIFRQRRIGKGGRPFTVYKFRSMVHIPEQAADGATGGGGRLLGPRGHLRITRVGRLARRLMLDELPTLLNVLKGDLGVFGPRPGGLPG